MSTKTNFKRIALVAVASLGLGLLSSVPSQGAVSQIVVSGVANGTATRTTADSLTAATITIQAMLDEGLDSLVVTVVPKPSTPSVAALLTLSDTVTARTLIDTAAAEVVAGATALTRQAQLDAIKNLRSQWDRTIRDTVGVNTSGNSAGIFYINADTSAATAGYVGVSLRLQLDSGAAVTQPAPGTYTYSIQIRSYDQGVLNNAKTVNQDISIVVAAPTSEATLVNGGLSSVTLGNTVANLGDATDTGATTADSSIAVAATASADDIGFVRVRLRNAAGGNAQESVTATISAGRIGDGTTMGRSVVLPYTSTDVSTSYKDLTVEADGTAGAATITISTPSFTFPSKSVTFYSTTTDKVTAASFASVIGTSGVGVHGSQFDAAGVSWGAGTALYAYSSDTTIISTYGTACTWNTTLSVALCTLAGVKNGTANITLRDAATVATSTKASNAVAVKVNLNPAATVALAFNKTSYVPGEKATVLVTVKDAAGATLPAATYTNLFAAGGLVSSSSLTAVSSTVLSNVAVTTMATVAASTDTPIVTADPVGQITVFMPMAGGTVTITGKGGTSLPSAGQVALTASATVTDNAAAALAAVTALATTVASLRTLITTLTNLVLKIQKKVKA